MLLTHSTCTSVFVSLKLCDAVCPGDNGSDWVQHWVKGGHNYYYNLKTKEGTWVEPESFQTNNTQLNKEDIQVRYCLRAALQGRSFFFFF